MLKTQKHNKHISCINLLTVLLVVLTTFSSCTVRKAMQDELNMQVTQTLNPIKSATVNTNHCVSFDETSHFTPRNENTRQLHHIIFPNFSEETFRSYFTENQNPVLSISANTEILTVPIYILFRQLKAFI
ncbi:MAG: hypothetical protein R2757_12490 [Draconibacterium sp.]